MPLYEYRAKNNRGDTIQNAMEADSEIQVAEYLHQQDLVVIAIRERKHRLFGASDLWGKIKKFQVVKKRVGSTDLFLFISQLGPLLKAGLTLTKALGSLARETKNLTLKQTIETVKQNVERGENFHVSLSYHPRIFPPLVVSIVRAGELSGELDNALEQLAEYLERSADLRRAVYSAIAYPVFLLSFLFVVMIFIMLKLVPVFQDTYSQFGVELPFLTQVLIGFSDFIRSNIVYISLGILGGISLIILLRRHKVGSIEYVFDGMKLKLPLFGPLLQKVAIARFSRTLAVITSSGIPILEGMNMAGQTSNNRLVERAVRGCVFDIERGSGIADSLATKRIFPEMLVQLISTGEQTGSLDDMLLNAARFYEKQIDATTKILTSIMEPILILMVAGVVGFILIALFLPIFNLGNAFMH